MSYNTKNYRKQGGEEWVIGGKQTIKSGGEVDFEAGSALKLSGKQTIETGGEVDFEAGSALKLSGKQTIETGGEVDFEDGSYLKFRGQSFDVDQINAATALVGAMVGGYAAAEHDDDTNEDAIEVMAANDNGDGDRAILIIVKCTETLAGTTLPTFQIGDGTVSNAFAKIGNGGSPATFAKDAIAVFAGTLTEKRPVEITVTDGTVDNEAGAIQVFVIALPVSA